MGVFTSKSKRQTGETRKLSIVYADLQNDDDLFIDSLIKKIEKHLLKKSNWKIIYNKKLECYYRIERRDYDRLTEYGYMKQKFFERLKKFLLSLDAEMIYPKKTSKGIKFRYSKTNGYKIYYCKFRYTDE